MNMELSTKKMPLSIYSYFMNLFGPKPDTFTAVTESSTFVANGCYCTEFYGN